MIGLGLGLIVAIGAWSGDEGMHLCSKHPAEGYHKGRQNFNEWWRRVSIVEGPTTPHVEEAIDKWIVVVNHTATNNDCAPEDKEVSVDEELTHQVAVSGQISIGGSVQAAAGTLFAKLAATASASVTFGGNYTDTAKEGIHFKTSKRLEPCDIKQYTFAKVKSTAKGDVMTYDHKVCCRMYTRRYIGTVWSPFTGGGEFVYDPTDRYEVVYCNERKLVGEAVGWKKETRDEWTQVGRVKPCPCDGGGDNAGGNSNGNSNGVTTSPPSRPDVPLEPIPEIETPRPFGR